jgi:hypothetical protein
LTQALPVAWNSLRKRTCGSSVQKKRLSNTKALRRKAGINRDLKRGYRKGCAMKKVIP